MPDQYVSYGRFEPFLPRRVLKRFEQERSGSKSVTRAALNDPEFLRAHSDCNESMRSNFLITRMMRRKHATFCRILESRSSNHARQPTPTHPFLFWLPSKISSV